MNRSVAQRRGFTLVELLVVISIIAIIAGLVVPVLLRGRGHAWKVKCTNNLKQIHSAASDYANQKNNYPRIGSGADATPEYALNNLLRGRHGKKLPAEVFDCPAGNASEPKKEGNRLVLDPDTNDYAWAEKVAKPTQMVPLAGDKYMATEEDSSNGGHEDVIVVLFTDGSVKAEIDFESEWWDEETQGCKGLTRGDD